MMNIFSIFVGTLIFFEVAFILALLKPFKEPYFIRDFWCNIQENSNNASKAAVVLLLFMMFNTLLEIFSDKKYYDSLLNRIKDERLILNFYLSKMTVSYICLFMSFYLLILIERLTHFFITIARLLEFELMCRHAILTRESAQESSSSTILTTKDDL